MALSVTDIIAEIGTISASNGPRCLRRRGAALAFQRERVLGLARDAVALRHDVGGLDHRHVDRRQVSHAASVPGESFCTFGCTRLIDSRPPATATGTPSRITRRAALAIASSPEAQNRETVTPADADRDAGDEGRMPRDVAAGGVLRIAAAEHDLLDLRRLDAGALHRGADGMRAEIGAVGQVQRAAERLADRRAGGGDDDGIGHAGLSSGLFALFGDEHAGEQLARRAAGQGISEFERPRDLVAADAAAEKVLKLFEAEAARRRASG